MRTILALALCLSGASQEEKRGPKNKDVQKAYAALMEGIGKENDALKKDLDEKKGDAAVKARLGKIKTNAQAASKLDYLKGSEEDVEKFKGQFGIFIDIRLKSFLEAEWNPETSPKLYARLQSACATCHELFRDE